MKREIYPRIKGLSWAILWSLLSASDSLGISVIEITPLQKSADGAQIGDRVPYTLTLPADAYETQGLKILLPTQESPDISVSDLMVTQGLKLKFFIVPLKSGNLIIPELSIRNNQDIEIAKTVPTSFVVKDLAEAKDAPQPETRVQIKIPAYYWWILILGCIGVLGIILVVIAKRTQRKVESRKPTAVVPKRAPESMAMEAIEKVYQQNPFHPTRLKPVAFGLSEVIKTYLSVKLNFDAQELTAQEILDTLKQLQQPPQLCDLVRTAFQDYDEIKFTHYIQWRRVTEVDYKQMRYHAEAIVHFFGHFNPHPGTPS